MAEKPQGKEPKLVRTDFESLTHEQLAALLDSATSEGASHLAGKLGKAASTIAKIGDDLMTHVKGLEWQGEGGDAFRDWGGQTASATLRLGQYAEVASRWMETVAQAVAEAKAAMPKVSETTQAQADLSDAKSTIAAAKQPGARNDPDARALAQTAQSDATAAQDRIDAARAEAIQQMQKLAQTYEYSAQQVNSVEPPTFSPPAGNTGSSGWWVEPGSEYVPTGSQYAQSGSGVSVASSHSGSVSTASHLSGGSASRADVGLGAAGPGQQPARTVPTAGMEIDGVGTLPDSSLPVSPTTSSGPHTGLPRPEAAPTVQPGVLPPAFGGGGSGTNPSPPGRLPTASRPSLLPGQGIANGAASRLPRESGILGGRPVTPGAGRSTGIPRGTVIGNGGTAQGRAPMTRGMTPGMPSAGGTSPGAGLTGGRRLASESGGIVGSRAQPGRTNARPFTPGGAGLVRSPSGSSAPEQGPNPARGGSGANTHPSNPTGPRRDQQHGQRPDYLVEDEETWAAHDRRAVPPVVD
ncbi:DUF4398 domain-containing protein [Streptomyces griseoruber]|uniref:DUF4398 domain-containing protein n=1 Tax=Streptomyces griseoruber TaxID=1943 RepID=UPI00099F1C16|nr:DUF4398 domain-containing protein [Streptomyces griseoruber]